MAKSFYKSTDILLVIPQPRGEEIRVSIGTREDGTEYVDVRTWYRDDADQLQPGKGLAKADINGVWDAIANTIANRAELKGQDKPLYYNPKAKIYEEYPEE